MDPREICRIFYKLGLYNQLYKPNNFLTPPLQ